MDPDNHTHHPRPPVVLALTIPPGSEDSMCLKETLWEELDTDVSSKSNISTYLTADLGTSSRSIRHRNDRNRAIDTTAASDSPQSKGCVSTTVESKVCQFASPSRNRVSSGPSVYRRKTGSGQSPSAHHSFVRTREDSKNPGHSLRLPALSQAKTLPGSLNSRLRRILRRLPRWTASSLLLAVMLFQRPVSASAAPASPVDFDLNAIRNTTVPAAVTDTDFATYSNASILLDYSPKDSIHRVLVAMAGSVGIHPHIPPEYVELHQTFNAGFVVLSFLIAFCGSFCTLELLLRRTSNRGLSNVLLLTLAGICFGAVSTFSMHFVGNNSLTLHHPLEKQMHYRSLSLSYSAGLTITSLVVSCTAMILAFSVMGLDLTWKSFPNFLRRVRGGGSSSKRSSRHHHKVHKSDSQYPFGAAGAPNGTNDPSAASGGLSDASLESPKSSTSADREFFDRDADFAMMNDGVKSSFISKDFKKRIKDLEMSTRLNNVMSKLEWALGWSMVDFGTNGGIGGPALNPSGNAKSRREARERAQADSKARKLDEYSSDLPMSSLRKSQGENVDPHHLASNQDLSPISNEESHHHHAEDEEEDDGRELSLAEFVRSMSEDTSGPAHRASVSDLPSPTASRSRQDSYVPELGDEVLSFPPAVFNFNPARRGSIPKTTSITESIFTPGYTFGGTPSTSQEGSTTLSTSTVVPPLFPNTAPLFPSQPAASDMAPVSVYAGRRASVPVNVYGGNAPAINFRDYELPPLSLARIQSLPESEEAAPPDVIDKLDASRRAAAHEIAEMRRKEVEQDHAVQEAVAMVRAKDSFADAGAENLETGSDARRGSLAKLEYSDRSRAGNANGKSCQGKRIFRISQRALPAKVQSFLGLDIVTASDVMKIVLTGFFCGIGIVTMHYIGQLSIDDIPYIAYSLGTVIGSVVIACSAVTVALYIMFIVFRPKLKHGWVSKIITAFVLAAAVCCMHYTAMAGTHYALRVGVPPSENAKRQISHRNAIIGICSGLAFAACLGILAFTVISQIRAISYRKHRRRVVVASILFDQDDRVLVDPEGYLPMADIVATETYLRRQLNRYNSSRTWDTDSTNSSVLDVDLSAGHPAFIAALRSTWAWRQPGVNPLSKAAAMSSEIPNELSNNDARRSSITASLRDLATYPRASLSSVPMSMNVARFLDKFVLAVSHLAGVLTGNEANVRRLGVLYDRVLTTGNADFPRSKGQKRKETFQTKGQLLFVVRRVHTTAERSQLLARNFFFAEPTAIANVMSKLLAVPIDDFIEILEDQREFCDYGMASSVKAGKVYTGVCVIQPTPSDGIQVLCDRQQRYQLPMRELCAVLPGLSQTRSRMSEKSDLSIAASIEELGEAVAELEGTSLFDLMSPGGPPGILRDSLADRLRNAIVENLVPMLDSMLSGRAMTRLLPRLIITPCLIPLMPPPPAVSRATPNADEVEAAANLAWVITFKAVLGVDTDLGPDVKWEPWLLFRAQNECVLRDGKPIGSATATQRIPTIEELQPRRPSKVQFSDEISPASSPAPTSEPSLQRLPSFPPTAGSRHPNPAIRALAGTSRSQSISGPSGRTPLSVTIPRRASVPGVVVETASPSATPYPPHTLQRSNHEVVREAALGVACWDDDWLVKMLRENLALRPAYQVVDDLV